MTAAVPAREIRWDRGTQLLHWAIALLVILQLGLGWTARAWELSPTKLDLFVWHKSTGMLLLALIGVRIVWRATHARPDWAPNMTRFERRVAWLTHVLLYMLLVLLPVTGWFLNSASGVPFAIFWTVPLPSVVAADEALADATATVHLGLSLALAGLLLLHVSAALFHHYARHDSVLTGMLPRRRARP